MELLQNNKFIHIEYQQCRIVTIYCIKILFCGSLIFNYLVITITALIVAIFLKQF